MLEKLAKNGVLDIGGSTFFSNKYSEKEFAQIMLELEGDDKTTSVIIRDRTFSEKDFEALGKMIQKNRTIQSLDLSKTEFSFFTKPYVCAEALTNALKKNNTLKTLIADNCEFEFTWAILTAIREAKIANLSLCGSLLTTIRGSGESAKIAMGVFNALIGVLNDNTSLKALFLSKVGFDGYNFKLIEALFDGLARSPSPLEQLYFSYEAPLPISSSFSITPTISESICAIVKKPTLNALLLPGAKLSQSKEDSKFLDDMLTAMEENTTAGITQLQLGNNSFPEPQHLRLQKILVRNLLLTLQKTVSTINIPSALKELEKDCFESSIFYLYKINLDVLNPILHEAIGLLFYLASPSKNDPSHYARFLTSSAIHLFKSICQNDDLVFENSTRVLERINYLLLNLKQNGAEIDWTKLCNKEINLKAIETFLPKLKIKKIELLQEIRQAIESFKKANSLINKQPEKGFFATKPLLLCFYSLITNQPDIDIQLLWEHLVTNDTQQEIGTELAATINPIFSRYENAFVDTIMPSLSSKAEYHPDENRNDNFTFDN